MFISDWDAFAEDAEALYRSNPLKVRYVLKYRHRDGKVVLKVTDNQTCLQYKTDQSADLRKIEKLNTLFFQLTADSEAQPTDAAASADLQDGVPMEVDAAGVTVLPAGVTQQHGQRAGRQGPQRQGKQKGKRKG